MTTWSQRLKRWCLLATLASVTIPSSGCIPLFYFVKDQFILAGFFGTTPLIPVTPFFTQEVEDTMYEEERYRRVPILEPCEGENAPIICLDPPSPDEIMRALPDEVSGGVPFLAETFRNNVRITVELIVDRVDEPRFFPQAGPARLHHCHYKCTVYYDKTKRSSWPIPFTHNDETIDVVYVDKDHLIRIGPSMDAVSPL